MPSSISNKVWGSGTEVGGVLSLDGTETSPSMMSLAQVIAQRKAI